MVSCQSGIGDGGSLVSLAPLSLSSFFLTFVIFLTTDIPIFEFYITLGIYNEKAGGEVPPEIGTPLIPLIDILQINPFA